MPRKLHPVFRKKRAETDWFTTQQKWDCLGYLIMLFLGNMK